MNEVEILIISNSTDFTTDYICIELNKRDCKYLRINRDYFEMYLINFNIDKLELNIKIADCEYCVNSDSLKSVYYRAPIYLHYVPAETPTLEEQLSKTQWMAFIRNLTVFEEAKWINHPNATFKGENKLLQLKYAKDSGFKCPKTLVTNSPTKIDIQEDSKYIVKSIDTVLLRERGKEAFSYTNIIMGEEILNSSTLISPMAIQELIEPKIDIRVTVIEDKVFPVKILKKGNGISGDWRKEKESVVFEPFSLPSNIEKKCIWITQKLGLRFGGIDLALSHGKYYFIEINPTGEWGWLLSASGLQIDKAICDSLCCMKPAAEKRHISLNIAYFLFPPLELWIKNRLLKKKIKSLGSFPDEYSFEYASKDMRISRSALEDAQTFTFENKKTLDDKAKSSLLAITVSAALMFNIIQIVQDLNSYNNGTLLWLISIGSLTMLFMVLAGAFSLYSLGEINSVSMLYPEDTLELKNKQKQMLAESIEMNNLHNMMRNNYMSTSYKCIIRSITLLIVIFIISSCFVISENKNKATLEDQISSIEQRINNTESSTVKNNLDVSALLNDLTNKLNSISNELDNSLNREDGLQLQTQIDNLKERIDLLQ